MKRILKESSGTFNDIMKFSAEGMQLVCDHLTVGWVLEKSSLFHTMDLII